MSDKETSVTPSELYDVPKSKGSANLVQKVRFHWDDCNFWKPFMTIDISALILLICNPVQCKFCDKVGNITVIPGRDKPYTLEDSESGKFVPVGCFDCRGIEPTEFSFRDGWAAEGVSIQDLVFLMLDILIW